MAGRARNSPGRREDSRELGPGRACSTCPENAAAGPDSPAAVSILGSYDTWCGVAHGCTRKLGLKICDLLPAKNGEEQTVQFLLEVVDILLNYVRKTFDRSTKVLDFHHPHQLLEGMEGFNLELSDHPESLEQILVDCRDTLKYGVRTGHPRFFNQLSTGLDIIGLAGEWLTSTANTNMFITALS
ncbi:Glutamate decarboxylase 1, partial [Eschrichtius robustus]|nr:Glutamate decarboxylase 1 [Eschrichtius robustus]